MSKSIKGVARRGASANRRRAKSARMKGYALAAVLVCVFLSTKASDYHRTVRYVDQIVMKW